MPTLYRFLTHDDTSEFCHKVSDALAKGADLARRIAEVPFSHNGQTYHVAVSYGAFAFDRSGEVQDVLAAADRAMYERKRHSTAAAATQPGGVDD